MDVNKRIEALETQVTALQDWLSIVLMMLGNRNQRRRQHPHWSHRKSSPTLRKSTSRYKEQNMDLLSQIQKEDIRNQIERQYANERLVEYQIKQGLVDDQHNATLLVDWIDRYGQGYRLDVNVDRAIRALRPQLHWQQLSEFTKRLAGF
jgi:hypothetical protein